MNRKCGSKPTFFIKETTLFPLHRRPKCDVSGMKSWVVIKNKNLVFLDVEVKTIPSDSFKSVTLKGLKKQLSLDNIEKKFSRNTDESSYQVITCLFKKFLREKKSLSNENLPDLRGDIFFRLGTVVVGTNEYWRLFMEN